MYPLYLHWEKSIETFFTFTPWSNELNICSVMFLFQWWARVWSNLLNNSTQQAQHNLMDGLKYWPAPNDAKNTWQEQNKCSVTRCLFSCSTLIFSVKWFGDDQTLLNFTQQDIKHLNKIQQGSCTFSEVNLGKCGLFDWGLRLYTCYVLLLHIWLFTCNCQKSVKVQKYVCDTLNFSGNW